MEPTQKASNHSRDTEISGPRPPTDCNIYLRPLSILGHSSELGGTSLPMHDSPIHCSFGGTADATFRIVKLTYDPDFRENYFCRYFDTSKYQDSPTDDTLYEYTSAMGLLSDPDIVFIPASPHPPVCSGPSVPAPINLVTVNPNRKFTYLFHRPLPETKILNMTKTITKYQINFGGPLTFKQVHSSCTAGAPFNCF